MTYFKGNYNKNEEKEIVEKLKKRNIYLWVH